MTLKTKKKVGIVGTGFIARGLLHALDYDPLLEVSYVLTRRRVDQVTNLPVDSKFITNDVDRLVKSSDIVVECSGDVLYGTEVVEHLLLSGLPVITMNAELQLTTGSMLSKLGLLYEAEGDQPGTLAALDYEVKSMGFSPLVYGNIKGFLNHTPNRTDMEYWSRKQGISLDKVTAFTDGTKVEIEQALVANGLGASIFRTGMQALACKSYEDGALQLGEMAIQSGQVIADYVVCAGAPAGVFIVATHDRPQSPYLEYLKLGTGPLYTIIKPYHLCHLEIPKTIRQVLTQTHNYIFNNGTKPQVQVVGIPKMDLNPGDKIDRAIGSFTIRGQALPIKDHQDAVPIGLLENAVVEKSVSPGQPITFSDVSLPKSRALQLWEAELFEQLKSQKLVTAINKPSTSLRLKRREPRGTWYRFLKRTNYQTVNKFSV